VHNLQARGAGRHTSLSTDKARMIISACSGLPKLIVQEL